MNRLTHRVRRLETRLGDRGPCRHCGGRWGVRIIIDGEPEPGPCEHCGETGKLIVLVRGTPPDERNSEEIA